MNFAKIDRRGLPPLELAKMAMPFFGGEEEAKASEETSGEQATATAETETTAEESGDVSTSQKLAENPEAVADLLKQLSEATKTIKDLSKKNEGYENERKQAERAQQTREQQLEGDLHDAQQTIAQMDAVIRHTAAINAIQNLKDYQFHSARHVLNEIDPNEFEITVDLQNGTATVEGIENAAKRVAKDMPWLVAQASGDKQSRNVSSPRNSGNPPSNPNSGADKAARRSDLMKKFPVIAAGRGSR
ncbi:MAG TPA: hypothetical protein PK852_02395 [Mesotoga prima]|uniref:phage scaffolding protein n=1 Tax=Mesotoga prima TaxID=1184387 RepID=UPI002BCF8033|nr:hypothetical protein [Mesotoga prima]HPE52944.1 hypothetical protein [Mesotoga prima]